MSRSFKTELTCDNGIRRYTGKRMKPYPNNNLFKIEFCFKYTAQGIAGGGMFTNQKKIEAKNANRALKKRARQSFLKDIKQQVSDYYLEEDMTIKPFPNKYINYVDFTDASIKTERHPIKWVECNSAFTAETSFGRAHISKKYKEAWIYSPTGSRQIYPDIKDINKLKQKVQDQHDIQISQVLNLWVSSSIKLKG